MREKGAEFGRLTDYPAPALGGQRTQLKPRFAGCVGLIIRFSGLVLFGISAVFVAPAAAEQRASVVVLMDRSSIIKKGPSSLSIDEGVELFAKLMPFKDALTVFRFSSRPDADTPENQGRRAKAHRRQRDGMSDEEEDESPEVVIRRAVLEALPLFNRLEPGKRILIVATDAEKSKHRRSGDNPFFSDVVTLVSMYKADLFVIGIGRKVDSKLFKRSAEQTRRNETDNTKRYFAVQSQMDLMGAFSMIARSLDRLPEVDLGDQKGHEDIRNRLSLRRGSRATIESLRGRIPSAEPRQDGAKMRAEVSSDAVDDRTQRDTPVGDRSQVSGPEALAEEARVLGVVRVKNYDEFSDPNAIGATGDGLHLPDLSVRGDGGAADATVPTASKRDGVEGEEKDDGAKMIGLILLVATVLVAGGLVVLSLRSGKSKSATGEEAEEVDNDDQAEPKEPKAVVSKTKTAKKATKRHTAEEAAVADLAQERCFLTVRPGEGRKRPDEPSPTATKLLQTLSASIVALVRDMCGTKLSYGVKQIRMFRHTGHTHGAWSVMDLGHWRGKVVVVSDAAGVDAVARGMFNLDADDEVDDELRGEALREFLNLVVGDFKAKADGAAEVGLPNDLSELENDQSLDGGFFQHLVVADQDGELAVICRAEAAPQAVAAPPDSPMSNEDRVAAEAAQESGLRDAAPEKHIEAGESVEEPDGIIG